MKQSPLAYMDPEEFGRMVALCVKAAIEPLGDRVAALEAEPVTKSLDVAAFDELAGALERVEKLEAAFGALAERVWNYRGYWREGAKAKRNDAYTHNGSLWLAMRDTSDAPDTASVDWNVIARKGRDGREAR